MASAQSAEALSKLPLEPLLKASLTAASKYEQNQHQVAVNVKIIIHDEIMTRRQHQSK